MKKRNLIGTALIAAAVLLCALAFAACDGLGLDSTEKTSLPAPVLDTIDDDSFRLSWSVVDNADGYIVSIDGTEQSMTKAETACSITGLALQSGRHTLKVKAVAAAGDTVYKDSAFVEYKEADGLGFETEAHIFEFEDVAGVEPATSMARAAGSLKIKGLKGYAKGHLEDIVIPESIGGVPVTVIAADAFKSNTMITSVVIAKTVTSVEAGAFSGCTGLASVTFTAEETVTTVAGDAFSNAGGNSLTVYVPDSKKTEYESTDGLTGKNVQATVNVESVTLSAETLVEGKLDLKVGASETLRATVKPETASNKKVTWVSSDTTVATVDDTGKVTALKAGPTTITVTTVDGGKTASCTVNVTNIAVTSVTVSPTTLTLPAGAAGTLTATVAPADATIKTINWSSDKPSVATVDSNGKVTAVGVGSATITVTTEDGGKTVTCAVTVEAADIEKLIASGIESLNNGDFDAAISTFEQAYTTNSTDARAIVYSTLGKLASIANSQEVQDFMSKRLGIKGYPGTINGLINYSDWIQEYPNEQLRNEFEYEPNKYAWWFDLDDDRYDYGFSSSEAPVDGAGYYKGTYVFVTDERKYETVQEQIRSYEDANGNPINWFNTDYTEFFTRYELTPQDGYYTFTLKLVSTELDSDDTGSPRWQYQDSNGNWINWFTAENNTEYFAQYGLTPQDGYYINTYKLVSTEPQYENVERELWSYDDENNIHHSWRSESDTFFSDYNLTPRAGYYKYAYVLVSPDPIYYDESVSFFPGMEVPNWIENSELYNSSFTSKKLPSDTTLMILMYSNLLDKNTDGLNTALDQLLAAVFGTNFEDAYARMGSLAGNVKLDAGTLTAFGINEFYEGDVTISKAELQALFAALRIFKASLEWVSAYDWNTDLNFLKSGALWDDLRDGGSKQLAGSKPASLPLRNNFLKDRGNGMMTKSKEDFIKAIDDAIAAYNVWISDSSRLPLPDGYKDILTDYAWAKAGLTQLKAAINGGTQFYVIGDPTAVSGDTYNADKANSMFGIDLGKFFTPGQLSLEKLIATKAGDTTTPEFYGFDNNGKPVAITKKEDIKNYEAVCFKFKTTPITEIVFFGLGDVKEEVTEGFIPPTYAEIIWDWYN